jgi:hypothetical protein
MGGRHLGDPDAAADQPAAGRRAGPVTPLSLLDRARANDPAAWQRLLALYRPLVLF